jgi:hypothetical protein
MILPKVRLILPEIICIQGKMYKPYIKEIYDINIGFAPIVDNLFGSYKVLALEEIKDDQIGEEEEKVGER